jgi:hypothetical protein
MQYAGEEIRTVGSSVIIDLGASRTYVAGGDGSVLGAAA